ICAVLGLPEPDSWAELSSCLFWPYIRPWYSRPELQQLPALPGSSQATEDSRRRLRGLLLKLFADPDTPPVCAEIQQLQEPSSSSSPLSDAAPPAATRPSRKASAASSPYFIPEAGSEQT